MTSFTVPPLAYSPSVLSPHISEETLSFHHGKHLAAYINNLNKLIEGDSKFANSTLEEIVMTSSGGLYNNAAQAWNHIFYFEQFSEGSVIEGELANRIVAQWGSVEKFLEDFNGNAATLFGSGWVWLSIDKDGKLYITKEENAGNPMLHDLTPLLTIDVWEHAYYLDYQNKRPEYINNFWEILDWKVIESRYRAIVK